MKRQVDDFQRQYQKNDDVEQQYTLTKQYFEKKTEELGLKNPRIAYDDTAFRIDIGYDSKEFSAIFHDFNSKVGQKARPLDYSPEQQQKDLLSEANQVLTQALPSKNPVEFTPENLTIQSESRLIKTCLSVDSGIVIGEIHKDKSPKQFLIDHMATFQAQGVTQLYMEHLLDSHQDLLDEYLQSPQGRPIPEPLACYLKLLDQERKLEGSATFTGVVQAAKDHGIRIIAIDTEITYRIGVKKELTDLYKNDEPDRCKAMNFMLLERFKQYHTNEKYVVFCGSAHASTCGGVPGVSDLLGCHNIVVHDVKPGQPETLTPNVDYDYDTNEKKRMHFDFLYERDLSPKKIFEINADQNSPSPQKNELNKEMLVIPQTTEVKKGPAEINTSTPPVVSPPDSKKSKKKKVKEKKTEYIKVYDSNQNTIFSAKQIQKIAREKENRRQKLDQNPNKTLNTWLNGTISQPYSAYYRAELADTIQKFDYGNTSPAKTTKYTSQPAAELNVTKRDKALVKASFSSDNLLTTAAELAKQGKQFAICNPANNQNICGGLFNGAPNFEEDLGRISDLGIALVKHARDDGDLHYENDRPSYANGQCLTDNEALITTNVRVIKSIQFLQNSQWVTIQRRLN